MFPPVVFQIQNFDGRIRVRLAQVEQNLNQKERYCDSRKYCFNRLTSLGL